MKRRVVLAQKIGFCFGVKRAVAMAEDALKGGRPIFSLGSLIHNTQVVEALERKGLKPVKDIGGVKHGPVVISSHGLSPRKSAGIRRRGIKIIDTTCPFVLKAQAIAARLSAEGYTVVIVGDSNHPEVSALVDFVPSGKVFVVRGPADAGKLKLAGAEKISVISQTTQSTANFLESVKAILSRCPREVRVFNTICKDAEERQSMALRLAKKVGLMLVVGGRDSANTKRLLEVCRSVLKNSHLVETERDLRKGWFKRIGSVGITSGASTPEFVIRKVVERIKSEDLRCK